MANSFAISRLLISNVIQQHESHVTSSEMRRWQRSKSHVRRDVPNLQADPLPIHTSKLTLEVRDWCWLIAISKEPVDKVVRHSTPRASSYDKFDFTIIRADKWVWLDAFVGAHASSSHWKPHPSILLRVWRSKDGNHVFAFPWSVKRWSCVVRANVICRGFYFSSRETMSRVGRAAVMMASR